MIRTRVSDHVVQALRTAQQSHPVQIWLDPPGAYTALVAGLAADPAGDPDWGPTVGYAGSFLALLRATAFVDAREAAPRLVVHLPGFADLDAVHQTPVCDLAKIAESAPFCLDLPAVIREAAAGLIAPDAVEAFIATGPTLADADAWLAGQLGGARAALDAAVQQKTLLQLIDDLILGEGLLEDDSAEARRAIREGVVAHTGLSAPWAEALGFTDDTARTLAAAAAAWAMCVEYVDDLRRAPISARLAECAGGSAPVRRACGALAAHLRGRHPAFYRQVAANVETVLEDERAAAVAADLGAIDTFRFEEEAFLHGAIAALEAARWDEAARWAAARAEGSFWVQGDAAREAAWRLIEAGARFGAQIAAATLARPAAFATLDDALDDYAARCAPVDRAHRLLEQRRVSPLFGQLPHFEQIHARLDALRARWLRWAQVESVAFAALCQRVGYLPSGARQQRNLFDAVVAPLVGDGRVAYFLVDALRFEMAQELAEHLDGQAWLTPFAAELPTVTEVGMNLLGPMTQGGQLTPIWKGAGLDGFRKNEFGVRRPDDRARVLREAVGGGKCPELSLTDAQRLSIEQLRRRIQGARLVLVTTTLFDGAGEKSVGPEAFAALLQGLRIACQRLHDAGIERLVITADHGFLLRRGVSDQKLTFGRKIDGSRRHAWGRMADAAKDLQGVRARDLGYVDDADRALIMPAGVEVFDTGDRPSGFVHGGNSPQERVIPALVVSYVDSKRPQPARFSATLTPVISRGAGERIRIEVSADQRSLSFTERTELALEVVVDGQPEVRIELLDARDATVDGTLVRAPVGRPCTVLFELVGEVDGRARVTVRRPDAPERLTVAPCAHWFTVRGAPVDPEDDATPASSVELRADRLGLDWLDALGDGDARIIYEHLTRHAGIGEAEVIGLLGSARKARRFGDRLEAFNQLAPFTVVVEVANHIKRFVRKEGGA